MRHSSSVIVLWSFGRFWVGHPGVAGSELASAPLTHLLDRPRLNLATAMLAGLLAADAAGAQDAPYIGQEGRAITSLSAEDVAAIEAGAGWELAKPAELNGWPGPRHALDLGAKLGLSPEQTAALEDRFQAMRADAIRIGADYLAAEAALDAAFATARQTRPRSRGGPRRRDGRWRRCAPRI